MPSPASYGIVSLYGMSHHEKTHKRCSPFHPVFTWHLRSQGDLILIEHRRSNHVKIHIVVTLVTEHEPVRIDRQVVGNHVLEAIFRNGIDFVVRGEGLIRTA